MKIAAYIIPLLLFIGCKKNNVTTNTNNSNANPPAPIIVNCSSGLPSNLAAINGVFLSGKVVLSFTPSIINYYGKAAFSNNQATFSSFCSPNLTPDAITGFDNIGSVKIDNKALLYQNGLNYYSDTSSAPNYSNAIVWSVLSTNAFPTYTANLMRTLPVLTSTINLPSSISKSSGFSINNISGLYTNTDSIQVAVSGNSFFKSKTFSNTTNVISFTASDLMNTVNGFQNAQLSVYFKNYSYCIVNSKPFVFVQITSIYNSVSVNP